MDHRHFGDHRLRLLDRHRKYVTFAPTATPIATETSSFNLETSIARQPHSFYPSSYAPSRLAVEPELPFGINEREPPYCVAHRLPLYSAGSVESTRTKCTSASNGNLSPEIECALQWQGLNRNTPSRATRSFRNLLFWIFWLQARCSRRATARRTGLPFLFFAPRQTQVRSFRCRTAACSTISSAGSCTSMTRPRLSLGSCSMVSR